MAVYGIPPVLPVWGETNQTSADMVQPAPSEIQTGWPESATPPSRQRFNWILFFIHNAVRYLLQRGITDYNPQEQYQRNARVIGDDGNTYVSLVDGNVGNLPSQVPTAWALWALSLAQINSATLTQATQGTGDASTKVANTAFVTGAVNTEASNRQTADNNLEGQITTAQNAANAAQTTANQAQTTAAAAAARQLTASENAEGRQSGQQYTNQSGGVMFVTGNCSTGGSGTGTVHCLVNGASVYQNTATASVSGGAAGFMFVVPPGATYQVNTDGTIGGVQEWYETVIALQ